MDKSRKDTVIKIIVTAIVSILGTLFGVSL